MAGDPSWGFVSLLLKANGAGGATSFVDESPNALTCTGVGGAALSAAGAKFDGMSIALGATGSFNFPTSAALTLTGDFTIEYFTSGYSVGGTAFKSADASLYLYNDSLNFTGGSISALGMNNTLGTWKHIAVTRSGTTVRVFQDGVLKGTGTTATSFDLSAGKFGQFNSNLYLQGSVDDLRITKGVARYTAAFTAPTAGFEVGPEVGIATAALTAPAAILVAAGYIHGWMDAIAPSPLLSSVGGERVAYLTAPTGTLYALGHDSTGDWSAELTSPTPTLSAFSGANARPASPGPQLGATGTATITGRAVMSAPAPDISASATKTEVASADVTAPSPNLIGYGGAVCSVTLTGRPTISATGTTGSVGNAAITCPLFELTATATAQNHGSANLIAPGPELGRTIQAWLTAPRATLTAIGSAVVTATYEAYAVNLKHNPRPGVDPVDEVTRYTNFPFTHVVRYQGSYYGANSTGLYLLEDTTDDTAPIAWAVKTALTDFKTPQLKTVASAYFGGRLGAAETITLHAGEGAQTQAYPYTTPRGSLPQNYRQAFGKGIRHHRYYSLAATGSGELELDNIDLDVHNLTRRI